MRFRQSVDDFVRRQQLLHKEVGWLLVAVVHQFAGFAQAVGPSGAQRQQYHIGLAHKVARALHQGLNVLQQVDRRVGPNTAVEVVALPAPARFHQVLLPVHFFSGRGAQQPRQRQRLKHGAKGVNQRFYLISSEARPDAIGKAGAYGEDPRRAWQLVGGRSNGYFCSKHRGKSSPKPLFQAEG